MKKHLLTLIVILFPLPAFANQAPPSDTASSHYLAVLPAEEVMIKILSALPSVQHAQAGIALSEAERRRLESGPYEWNIGGETAKRRVSGDGRYNEYNVTLERPLRWIGKAQKDTELGSKTIELSEASYQETLHEAARTLLSDWFEYLREYHAMQRLDEQVELYSRLLNDINKRLQSGDIPRMEALLAETEYKRLQATQQQAKQRTTLQRIKLEKKYAGLPVTLPYTTLASLPPPIQSIQPWVTQLLDDNHAITGAQLATVKARLQVERSTLEQTPDPTLSLRYSSERSNEEKIIGIAISIPLPGEGRRADQAASAAQLSMAHENERQIRTLAEQEAYSLIARFNDNQRIAITLAQIARQAQETATLINKAYMLGESPFADTLLAGRQALEAQQAAEDAHLGTLEIYAQLLLDTHKLWASQKQETDNTTLPDHASTNPPQHFSLFPQTSETTLTP